MAIGLKDYNFFSIQVYINLIVRSRCSNFRLCSLYNVEIKQPHKPTYTQKPNFWLCRWSLCHVWCHSLRKFQIHCFACQWPLSTKNKTHMSHITKNNHITVCMICLKVACKRPWHIRNEICACSNFKTWFVLIRWCWCNKILFGIPEFFRRSLWHTILMWFYDFYSACLSVYVYLSVHMWMFYAALVA